MKYDCGSSITFCVPGSRTATNVSCYYCVVIRVVRRVECKGPAGPTLIRPQHWGGYKPGWCHPPPPLQGPQGNYNNHVRVLSCPNWQKWNMTVECGSSITFRVPGSRTATNVAVVVLVTILWLLELWEKCSSLKSVTGDHHKTKRRHRQVLHDFN